MTESQPAPAPTADRIVIAAASGCIGHYLAREFRRQGARVALMGG